MLLDWLAVFMLLGLYVAFANKQFVIAVRRFAADKHHGLLLAVSLVVPFFLLVLPEGRGDPAAFLLAVGKMLLYVLVPALASLFRPAQAKPLHPLDILAFLALWFPIEFGWLPDVDAQLADGVSIPIPLFTGVLLALVCFLGLRPLPNIGYTFALTRDDFGRIGWALAAYMLIGVPLGLLTGFLIFDVTPFEVSSWLLAWPLGFLFTALPEELLFRGVIQNQLHERLQGEWLALVVASIIFGLAHLNNSTPGYSEPNWMYALMATLAGLAYGWTWRRTGKITAAAVVHATVNYVWGLLLSGA